MFIDPACTEDGEAIPSSFMREVGLYGYEPGCIEAIHHEGAISLRELLADASYAEQWLERLERSREADAAICVLRNTASLLARISRGI